MSKKLFVGGLAWATTDESLKSAFAPFGNIVEAKVICDRQTGRSRGFGFVTYDNEESAYTARQTMHEQTLEGRTIRIDFADDSAPRSNANRPRRAPVNRQNDAAAPYQGEKSNRGEKKRSPLHPAADYNPFVADDGGRGGRDNRRKDKKRDRDRYEDDDRW